MPFTVDSHRESASPLRVGSTRGRQAPLSTPVIDGGSRKEIISFMYIIFDHENILSLISV